ncbi:mitochondrial tRNA-specific 2-thiouridylase 1 [Cimex lectularius]|uniref:tRNA-5-taurinomethyluridine 2-sulfurtransferase n=1 Tax=Cimex lectularius TaxID=79782 RepID=A0A8I6R7X0_CIMLE|nr:mitochondrial tRNA-specific 2-thiouridylase 1 [Cimex lectularius]
MKVLKGIKKVALGVSGGVDSAVAGLLLKKRGIDLIGVFMKNWDIVDEQGFCDGERELEDAESICKTLGIQFKVVNFVKEYWNEVFTELIADYEKGLTPNPDILCNKNIKFKHFSDYAFNRLGCDTVATGHYARNSFGEDLQNFHPSGANLLTAVDSCKDQTFFLSQIPQDVLQRTIFPLGSMLKSVVKKIAFENNFERIAKKKESMGICFIGSRNFQSFISEYIKPKECNLIDIDSGKIVGKHLGKHCLTIGQRCNIPGTKKPYYVGLKTDTPDILVAMGHSHPLFHSSQFITHIPYWINSEPSDLENNKIFHCKFRFQHRDNVLGSSVMKLEDGKLHVMLEKPVRALTPGQFAVFYKGEVCCGSAPIDYVGPTEYSLNYYERYAKPDS